MTPMCASEMSPRPLDSRPKRVLLALLLLRLRKVGPDSEAVFAAGMVGLLEARLVLRNEENLA